MDTGLHYNHDLIPTLAELFDKVALSIPAEICLTIASIWSKLNAVGQWRNCGGGIPTKAEFLVR